jgi:hypothetical protein
MIAWIIALIAGCAAFAAASCVADIGYGWSAFLAVVAFGACQIIVGLFVRKRVTAEMNKVQAILADGQRRLQQKMQRWQMRPPGSIKEAQREIAADTAAFVKEALAQTSALEKFRLWVPLMDRQIATARLQLNWMTKDFAAVDTLFDKAIFVDPTLSCMKMARMQMLDRPIEEIRKVYNKGVRRVRYNGNVLLAATMSWIEVKRGLTDAAFKTLTEALKKSDDETLKRNHECLMNNRVSHFSNSGLGDVWYSLYLEEPRVRAQRQRPVFR